MATETEGNSAEPSMPGLTAESPPKRPGFFCWRRRVVFAENNQENEPPDDKTGTEREDPSANDATATPPDEHRRHRWRHAHHEHRRWRHEMEKYGPGYNLPNSPDGQNTDPTGHHGYPPDGPCMHRWGRMMWSRWGNMMQTEEKALFKEFDF